jgi:hypothetical protein
MASEQRPDIETLALTIAHSPIVVARALAQASARAAMLETMRSSFPAGFDDADIAVLHWIAAEGRIARRLYSN